LRLIKGLLEVGRRQLAGDTARERQLAFLNAPVDQRTVASDQVAAPLEHRIAMQFALHDGLAHLPMLGDEAALEAKNVYHRQTIISGFTNCVHMHYDKFLFRNHPLDVASYVRKGLLEALEIVNKADFPVGNDWIMLDVIVG
jgi:hypothetical protein